MLDGVDGADLLGQLAEQQGGALRGGVDGNKLEVLRHFGGLVWGFCEGGLVKVVSTFWHSY